MDNKDYYWWKADKGRAYESIFPYIRHLNTEQGYRQQDNFKFMRLYGAQELYGLRAYHGLRTEANNPVLNRITLNIIQSMIDTVVSKIAKNKPKPTFLTEGGNWGQQSRAKKLTQFLEGQYQSTEFYELASRAFLDSCIFGTGCLKIFIQDGSIKVERVFIDEIIIDDKESFYGQPRQMHQHKMIHKDVLKGMFPEYAGAIEIAGKEPIMSYGLPLNTNTDMVMVLESWHLKSGEDATDGKHVISIENQDLLAEDYDKDYFPFVFWRWGLRPLGFFGQGLGEQLAGLQLEINKILKTIQVSMHLVSVPKIFIEANSKVISSHLDNKIGAIIKYTGKAPEPGQLGVIPPELFAHLDRLYQRAYEIAGVSQLSATSAKPAGLNSGKALREYNDLETERFMTVAQRYEKVFLDAGRIMIDLAKDLNDELEDGYAVKVKGKKFLKTIKWKDVDMEEDQYVMSLFPTSALSSSPAGRLQDVQELITAGFVSKEDAMKLLDFPDLQSFYNFETAPGEDIDMVIEKIVEDGDYMTPEPYQNLEYGIQKMQKAYLLFRSQNLPEVKLELIRRWMEDAGALIERAAVNAERVSMEAQAQMQTAAQEAALRNAPQSNVMPPENDMAPPEITPEEAIIPEGAAQGLPQV